MPGLTIARYPCRAATLAARTILHAVPQRIETMLEGIPAAAAAGDEGMANLIAAGRYHTRAGRGRQMASVAHRGPWAMALVAHRGP